MVKNKILTLKIIKTIIQCGFTIYLRPHVGRSLGVTNKVWLFLKISLGIEKKCKNPHEKTLLLAKVMIS